MKEANNKPFQVFHEYSLQIKERIQSHWFNFTRQQQVYFHSNFILWIIIFIPKEIQTFSNPLRLPISSPNAWIIRIRGYTKLFLNSVNEIKSARMRGKTRRGESRVLLSIVGLATIGSRVKVGKKLIAYSVAHPAWRNTFSLSWKIHIVEIHISETGLLLVRK